MNSVQISVIIPAYQRFELVARALAEQTLEPDKYEVLVWMDGSTDGMSEMIAQYSLNHALYQLYGLWQPNAGRGAACNVGIRAAKVEIIVLLDDMKASPQFLSQHWQMDQPIRIEPSNSPLANFVGVGFNNRLEKLSQPDHIIMFRDVYTGIFSIRRNTILSVGGFDEDFKVYCYEDYELALRPSRFNVQFSYSPKALAHQEYTKVFKAFARDNVSRGHMTMLLVMKHPQTFGDLTLSTCVQASLKWRLLRSILLAISLHWSWFHYSIIAFMSWLEQRRPMRLHLYFSFAVDYYDWLGVRQTCVRKLNLKQLQQAQIHSGANTFMANRS